MGGSKTSSRPPSGSRYWIADELSDERRYDGESRGEPEAPRVSPAKITTFTQLLPARHLNAKCFGQVGRGNRGRTMARKPRQSAGTIYEAKSQTDRWGQGASVGVRSGKLSVRRESAPACGSTCFAHGRDRPMDV